MIDYTIIKTLITGDFLNDDATLKKYSRDASLFEIKPKAVIYPKNKDDIKAIVRFVNENKTDNPELSITMRAAGTDMTGGPLNSSIIIDTTRYMNKIIHCDGASVTVEPGCYYRDLDLKTREFGSIMPAYTASRDICAVGGMVSNNSGGEKSIYYGKTERYVKKLKVIFTDGNEYEVKPLTFKELTEKIEKDNFESNIYKKIHQLIEKNFKEIMSASPQVSKNSSGYYLWNVYDEKTGIFDLNKLIVGSQGTLGIVTEITFDLVKIKPYSNVLAIFLPSLDKVSDLVNVILPYKPESLETYDDYSMKLAVRFFFDFFKQLGFSKALKLGLQFMPELGMLISGGVPKLILMVEAVGDSPDEVKNKLIEIERSIKNFRFHTHIAKDSAEADKYWRIRHESFNLLRKHIHGKRTAPFIDDVIVKPEYLPEFLPKIKKLLDFYKLDYTVQGHLGNGNFHIIPLMDMKSPYGPDIILDLSKKVYALVKEYHGSNSAEHNDGIIRTPYLEDEFGKKIVNLFEETKNIFDPKNILNPGKKVGGSFENIKKYLIKNNQA